jgi:hypothetical protein
MDVGYKNCAFLMPGWISGRCPSGIAATDATIDETTVSFTTTLHEDVSIDLIGERIDVYEIH